MGLDEQVDAGGAGDAGERGPGPEPSDEELMERIRDGDEAAHDALVERYWTTLMVYAEGFVRRREVARDVAQETFVRVWEHRSSWNPTGSANAYLHRITRNLALNEIRRLKHREEWAERGRSDLPGAEPPRTPAEVLDAEELRRLMEEAIDALPPRRREIFLLARFHGCSYEEIAAALGISPHTVSNQMTATLRELRRVVSERMESG